MISMDICTQFYLPTRQHSKSPLVIPLSNSYMGFTHQCPHNVFFPSENNPTDHTLVHDLSNQIANLKKLEESY
jgi:hypothetical protein